MNPENCLAAHARSNTLEVLELTKEFTWGNTFPHTTVLVAEEHAGCDCFHHSENNAKTQSLIRSFLQTTASS